MIIQIRSPLPRLLCALLPSLLFLQQLEAADPPGYTGKGVGFYREPVDGKKKDPHDDCMKEKKEILDQIQGDRELYELYRNNPEFKNLVKLIQADYEKLKKRFEELKKSCPGAQAGDPSWKIPDNLPPLDPDPKDPPIQSDALGNALLTGAVTSILDGAVVAGGEGAATFLTNEAGGEIGELTAKEAATKALEIGVHVGIDEGADAVYDTVQEIRNEESSNTEHNPERQNSSRRLYNARTSEMRTLGGFTAAYGRYHAAMQAGDAKAAARHLEASLQFSQMATAQARDAAGARSELEQKSYEQASKNFAALSAKGEAGRAELAQRQQQIKQSGLPKSWVDQLTAAGVPPQRIEELRQKLQSLTPQQIESVLATRKDRAMFDDAMKKSLAKANSKAPWPEPGELPELSALAHQARQQLQQLNNTRIDLSAADEAGKPANLPKMWAVPSGQPLRMDHDSLLSGGDSGPLAPGKYDVYLDEADGDGPLPSAVCMARGVSVEEGKPAKVPLRSGIRFKTTDDLPAPAHWFVVPADASYATVLAKQSGSAAEPVWLPAGNYDVYTLQASDQNERPVCVARGVKVADDAVGDVAVRGCKVQIQTPSWAPPCDPGSGWWGLAQSGDKRANAVVWTRTEKELVAPPGSYDLIWVQDAEHRPRPMALVRNAQLTPDHPLTISAKSGMKLKLPQNAPALDANDGWWGAVPAFGKAAEPINWCIGRTDQPLLLAPGTYDVVWKQDGKHQPRRLASGITVAASNDGPTEVTVSPEQQQ